MNVAIMAHDNKKELMVQFCTAYAGILSQHNLYATNATGHQVANATSYMGLASLDLSSCLRVRTEGTDSEHAAFRKLAAAFVVE